MINDLTMEILESIRYSRGVQFRKGSNNWTSYDLKKFTPEQIICDIINDKEGHEYRVEPTIRYRVYLSHRGGVRYVEACTNYGTGKTFDEVQTEIIYSKGFLNWLDDSKEFKL